MLLDPSTEAFLAGRPDIRARWLIWIEAKNRLTGAEQTQGFWTGDDDATFTIGGQSRDYFGAGGFIALRELPYEAGTIVQMQRLSMGPVTEEVKQALRTYEPRLAPVEVHLALFDPITNALVGTPRAFTGWIDDLVFREAALENGSSGYQCDLTLASSSREGTRTLPLKKSDSAQQERSGDRGRRYAAVAGSIPVWWGEQRHVPAAPVAATPNKPAGATGGASWDESRGH
ncbi:hypothetical protein GCM10011534_12190 [Pseudooceanicola nanhaiensis]|jgi:hypothetical protein|uniref:Uncharacterized protein n=1 Tax=Pseudooceanicola nanhaiensis TaxID=375761 RepID=A0A917SPV9_9RHOB|nr:hypothetical protein [Pseudooceanicola nanhaiensis]GGL91572.1 hypothetical protein GCM10011534_12190 [Pseudooceanicola nanhaiensis]